MPGGENTTIRGALPLAAGGVTPRAYVRASVADDLGMGSMLEVFAPLQLHEQYDDPPALGSDHPTRLVDVMSRTLIGIAPELSIERARSTGAAHDVHHMVVVSPGETGFRARMNAEWLSRFGQGRMEVSTVVGIVCGHDLDAWQPNAKVREAMTYPVFCVSAQATLGTVAAIMRERSVGALPVLGSGAAIGGRTVLGIVTRHDLRRAGLPEEMFAGARCAACGGKRRVRWDVRTDGFATCCVCRESARPGTPDAEMGVGD